MKIQQVYAEYVESKFGTVVIRFTYSNRENMHEDPFTLDVQMRSNELLINLTKEQTFNLLRNFTEHLKEVLRERFRNQVPLKDPYYYQSEIDEGWLRKNYDGGITGNMITG